MIIPSKKYGWQPQCKKKRQPYSYCKKIQMGCICFFLPTFIFALLFNYIPIVGVQIAFRNYQICGRNMGEADFVGFKYFIRMFREPTFLQVMRKHAGNKLLKIGYSVSFRNIFCTSAQ